MTRDGYQDRLDRLEADVLYMSELVLERLRQGLEALAHKDDQLGLEIIESDHEINELYLELEQDCIDLLALHQPVAGDLRFIAASFKIITDLERVGDLATNLGQYTRRARREQFPEVDVQEIGDRTIGMLEDAMAAYADGDAEACRQIATRDEAVDELCEAASETVVRELVGEDTDAQLDTLMQDVRRLLLTIRDLERVGDHAVNIAARTLYMTDSDETLLY